MNINKKARVGIVAGAGASALAIVALLGTASANAADGTPSPGATNGDSAQVVPADRPMEEELTGDAAAKVRAAVEAKYPDATIMRMETDADGQGVYEAHLRTADGSHLMVFLDEGFAITGEQEGRMGPGGRGGHGGPGGQRPDETPLEGDAAAKVRAAVEAKYPDATIMRMETDADGQGVYEAHLRAADGSHLMVFLDEGFAITGEQEGPMGRGPGGPRGPRGPHSDDAAAASATA